MKNIIITLLSVLVLVLAVFAGYAANNKEIVEKEVVVTQTIVDNSTLDKLADLEAKLDSLDEFEVEADEKLQNDTAKDLVLAELDKKSFMKAILAVLEDNSIENKSIESYKDLSIYSVKIKSSELDGDEAVVTVEVKYNFNEYNDSNYPVLATLSVEFLVSNLDIDDNFEDAEVKLESLKLLRVKELA